MNVSFNDLREQYLVIQKMDRANLSKKEQNLLDGLNNFLVILADILQDEGMVELVAVNED